MSLTYFCEVYLASLRTLNPRLGGLDESPLPYVAVYSADRFRSDVSAGHMVSNLRQRKSNSLADVRRRPGRHAGRERT